MLDLRQEAAKLLTQIPVGEPLGTELFNAVAGITPIIAVEAVVFREWEGKLQVFMTQRGPNESYPEQWHPPGSIFRNCEQPINVFKRLELREFGVRIRSFQQVSNFFHQEERGWMLSIIYIVKLTAMPNYGQWFSPDELPVNTVPHHLETVIPKAVEAYRLKNC